MLSIFSRNASRGRRRRQTSSRQEELPRQREEEPHQHDALPPADVRGFIELIQGDLPVDHIVELLRRYTVAPEEQEDTTAAALESTNELLHSRMNELENAIAIMHERIQRQVAMLPVERSSLIPSASKELVAKLPRSRILPTDRKAFANDTSVCAVCSDRLIDGVALIRLPCGHLYHINCCIPWLSKSCTCPECRYEMPTDDSKYERGRVERMKDRKTFQCSCHPSGHHACFFADPSKSLSEQLLEQMEE